MKNWQGIFTTRLPLGGEVMVPRDNSTLAFSTELLDCIIARLQNHNVTDDDNVDFRSFRKILYSKHEKLMLLNYIILD